jgi:hypothetical protein
LGASGFEAVDAPNRCLLLQNSVREAFGVCCTASRQLSSSCIQEHIKNLFSEKTSSKSEGVFFMSEALEKSVIKALTQSGFTTARSHCQMFLRQNIQRVYGPLFDQYHKASAKESAQAWQKTRLWLAGGHPSVPGDILYYTSPEHGEYGHVAVRIHDNRVAENSVVHFDETGDGRGTRPLEALGKPSLIVRLPEPTPPKPRTSHD